MSIYAITGGEKEKKWLKFWGHNAIYCCSVQSKELSTTTATTPYAGVKVNNQQPAVLVLDINLNIDWILWIASIYLI
jgi:hypothetical protein